MDSQKSKMEGDLSRLRQAETTKLIIASGVCFVLGLVVAVFIGGGS